MWKVGEALIGHKLSYAIATKGGETVAAQGKKITNSVYKEILKSRIDAVQVESNDLEGAYVAADVIDMETGEVLIEANHELTPTIIGKVMEAGIKSVEIFFPELDDVGNVLSQTLKKDGVKQQNDALLEIYRKLRPGDPPTVEWAQKLLGVRVVDHWWQTETGWAICGNFEGLEKMPIKPGSCSVPAPGWDMQVLDEHGRPMKAGEVGALAARLPLPPGTFPTLWNADARYRQAYMTEFPGYYKTGDAGYIDDDGYVSVMTRVDDVINVAGHRLSTGQIEEVLGSHNDVAECAVIGVADDLKGQVPLGFLVLKAGVDRPHGEIVNDVVTMVRDRIGPVAFFKSALVVQRLPKTRSGKILRGTMQKIADSQTWTMPATIEDPVVLEEIKDGLKGAGFAAKG